MEARFLERPVLGTLLLKFLSLVNEKSGIRLTWKSLALLGHFRRSKDTSGGLLTTTMASLEHEAPLGGTERNGILDQLKLC